MCGLAILASRGVSGTLSLACSLGPVGSDPTSAQLGRLDRALAHTRESLRMLASNYQLLGRKMGRRERAHREQLEAREARLKAQVAKLHEPGLTPHLPMADTTLTYG